MLIVNSSSQMEVQCLHILPLETAGRTFIASLFLEPLHLKVPIPSVLTLSFLRRLIRPLYFLFSIYSTCSLIDNPFSACTLLVVQVSGLQHRWSARCLQTLPRLVEVKHNMSASTSTSEETMLPHLLGLCSRTRCTWRS